MTTSLSPIVLLRNNLLINTIGWTILLPSMPVIYAHFGANTASIGVLVSFVAMITFACGAVQGFASDYLGRLVMLRICAVAQLFGHILTIYSLYTYSFELFVVARCLPAVFKCCMVVSQAFLFDIESQQDPGAVSTLGSLYACSNVAFIIGPLMGGFCIARSMYLANAIGCVLSLVELGMLTLMKELPKKETAKEKEITSQDRYAITPMSQQSYSSASYTSHIRSLVSSLTQLPPRLVMLLHIKFAYQLSNCLFESMFPMYGRIQFGLSGYATGVFFSLSGALSAVTNMYLLQRALASCRHPDNYLWCYLIVTALGLYVWALWSSLNGLVVATVVVTVSSNLFQGVLQNTIMISMKELREGNNNLDVGTPYRDDVEEGHPVEKIHPEVVTRSCDDDTETNSPCSVTSPHLRTRQTKNHHLHLTPRAPGHNLSNSNSNARSKDNNIAGAGAVFGLSTSADRAARVVSPILGGVLIHHFNTSGLVVLITASTGYALALLLYSQSIHCVGLASLVQDGSVHCANYISHARSRVEKVLQSFQVKRGLDTETLYYGGEKRVHEKYL